MEFSDIATIARKPFSPDQHGSSEKPAKTEAEIKSLEENLGVKDRLDRISLASLFIDKNFLNIAAITSNTNHPERLFGDKEWADFLQARKSTIAYGRKDLTPEFITEIQRLLTQRSQPDVSGKIRDWAVIGADYTVPGKPVKYTKEQIDTINQNEFVAFTPAPGEDETTGFIVYPSGETSQKTQELLSQMLVEVCSWYNQEKAKPDHDPVALAANLQRKIVSIHPFKDLNGTASRLLMNWSLRNDGKSESAVENPGDDLLMSEDRWTQEVKRGMDRFSEIKRKKDLLRSAGYENIAALLGVGQEQAFYKYIFRHIQTAPPIPKNGEKVDHALHNGFVISLAEELRSFSYMLHHNSFIDTANGNREVSQGGLVSDEMIFLYSNPQKAKGDYLADFFSDVEVFRGGQVLDAFDEQKILSLFTDFQGVDGGYRALARFGIPAMTNATLSPSSVTESIDYYNKLIASSYFGKTHPDLNPYSDIEGLTDVVYGHVGGGEKAWSSPFTSSSFDKGVSLSFARAGQTGYGVLIKSMLPKEGVVLSFGSKAAEITGTSGIAHEREALIPGGINPSAITEIEVFLDGYNSDPKFIVRRIPDDSATLEMEDRTGEFVVQKTFAQNSASGQFDLVSTVTTDRKVEPLPRPKLSYLPSDKFSIEEFMGKIKPHDPYHTSTFDFSKIVLTSSINYFKEFKDFPSLSEEYKDEKFINYFKLPPSQSEESFFDKKQGKNYYEIIHTSPKHSLLGFSEEPPKEEKNIYHKVPWKEFPEK